MLLSLKALFAEALLFHGFNFFFFHLTHNTLDKHYKMFEKCEKIATKHYDWDYANEGFNKK